MDLRAYFQKIRQLEGEISEPHVVVVSEETQDGGKPGMSTEVPRAAAAKLVVEGRARLATAVETDEYRRQVREAHERLQRDAQALRYPVAVVSEGEFKNLRVGIRGQKP